MVNIVTLCENCKRKINIQYGCCICQRAFCIEHVSPERHQCAILSQTIRHWYNYRKLEKNKNYRIGKSIKLILMVFLTLSSIIVVSMGVTLHNITLRNPTFEEALQFISKDQTEKRVYRSEKYTCYNFAKDLQANAQSAGFNCGYVVVFFVGWSHALNCFNTTDLGLIYVEPQLDKIVTLEVGKAYWGRMSTSLFQLSYDDTVIGFIVNW